MFQRVLGRAAGYLGDRRFQYDEDDITVPFGGYKQSGNGRDKSLHAFDKYTELKTTWIRIDQG